MLFAHELNGRFAPNTGRTYNDAIDPIVDAERVLHHDKPAGPLGLTCDAW